MRSLSLGRLADIIIVAAAAIAVVCVMFHKGSCELMSGWGSMFQSAYS